MNLRSLVNLNNGFKFRSSLNCIACFAYLALALPNASVANVTNVNDAASDVQPERQSKSKLMQTTQATAEIDTTGRDSQTLKLRYKDFYSHLRKLDSEDYPDLQFVFGFMNQTTGKMCQIQQAYIHTQKQDIPLSVSEHRFSVPKERALNLADAEVNVSFKHGKERCDMSVLLKANLTRWTQQETISAQSLRDVDEQFRLFFEDVGSFLAFLMPDTKGISIHFYHTTELQHANNWSEYLQQAAKIGIAKNDIDVSEHGVAWHLSRYWLAQNQTALPNNAQLHYISAWVN